jgi:hypothetical protein
MTNKSKGGCRVKHGCVIPERMKRGQGTYAHSMGDVFQCEDASSMSINPISQAS